MSMVTLGVRLGTLAAASRDFGTKEIRLVGQYILVFLDGLAANPTDNCPTLPKFEPLFGWHWGGY